MTDQELQELEAALELADQIKARISTMTVASRPVTFDEGRITVLAAAVRSLRETVQEREEEIARLKADLAGFRLRHPGVRTFVADVNPSLDEALNSGTGDYKP